MNRIVSIVLLLTALLAGCAGPVAFGVGPNANHPNRDIRFVIAGQSQQPLRVYCARGMLMKRSDGEVVCLYKKVMIENGVRTELVIEETPSTNPNGGSSNNIFGSNNCPAGTVPAPRVPGQPPSCW